MGGKTRMLWGRNYCGGTVSVEASSERTAVEVSALKPAAVPGLRGPTALMRLQTDERLIALIRRGQHAAFEVLFSRYRARLLAFCRHMLGSREDAEDVLQEVFAAAFNAILADDRPINVRPWLYRIARNRSLNHLRRASAIGIDSMDVHFADNGLSTAEKVMRRESFRQLIGDVQQLAETQRTALLLREIDALSYEQIAHAMETTVPAVKSLLVRARISLAEAAEARKLTCEEARLELGEVAEGLVKLSPAVRRHARDCARCRTFRKQLKQNNIALAAIFPVGPLLLLKKLALTKLGSTAGAGGAHVAGAGSAGAAAASGATATGSLLTAGTSALATKAVAGLAVAAIVTAGTVEAEHANSHPHRSSRAAIASVASPPATAVEEPVVTGSSAQPVTPIALRHGGAQAHKRRGRLARKPKVALASPSAPAAEPAATPPVAAKPAMAAKQSPVVTQVTTETTQLPSSPPVATPTSTGAQSVPTTATAPEATTDASTGGGTAPETQSTTTTTTTTTPPPPPPTQESGSSAEHEPAPPAPEGKTGGQSGTAGAGTGGGPTGDGTAPVAPLSR
jgi:RNA polymerase sigma factor (sigma-70 family)